MNSTTADGAAIHAAILAEPHDDLHRLAYADWLEENGQDSHAGFIRADLCRPIYNYHWYEMRKLQPPWMWSVRNERNFCDGLHDDAGRVVALFDRGFVCAVRCQLAEWERHGRAIVAVHPIERVTLTDRRPRARPAGGNDFRRTSHEYTLPEEDYDLPHDLWVTLYEVIYGTRKYGTNWWAGCGTAEMALHALSDACLLLVGGRPPQR